MPMITRLRSGRGTRRNYAALAGKTTRRRAAAKPRISKPAAKAVRAIAKSVVKREAETKYVSLTQDLSFNSTISSASECYRLMPDIPQGSDDFQRIGDKVSGKYLYVKGHVQYNSSFINTPLVNNYVPPSTIRLMILTQKNIKANAQISSLADVSQLLKDNVATGVARAYVGAMTDNLAPINKDLFRVHLDRKIKMKAIYQSSDNTGTGGWTGLPTYYFSCRIKLPKTLSFDATNGNSPNNFAPFLCMGSVLEDGSSPFSIQTPYRLTFLSTAYYDDA